MVKDPRCGGARRLSPRRLASLLMSDSSRRTAEASQKGDLAHRLTRVAAVMGMIAAVVGVAHLAAWLGGYMTQRGLTAIIMKTNTALCLTSVGVALMLLVPPEGGLARRWTARICAVSALLVGLLTLVENLSGWDFGIDQLLAVETPGALAVASPNRMGTPASLSFTLIGLALLIFSRRDHRGVRVMQALALAVCLIALLPTVGFLYGAEQFYGITQYTGIAWPTAVALLLMGLALLCARPAEGLMSQVTANDPGGVNIRRLLPAFVILPLLLGWLCLAGERAGIFDAATGTGMVMLLFIIIFSVLTYHASRGASRSSQALRESEERLRLAIRGGDLGVIEWDIAGDRCVWQNQRMFDIFGRTVAHGPLNRAQLSEQALHPDDVAGFEAAMAEAMKPGNLLHTVFRIRRTNDGELRWIETIGRFERDAEGHPLRLVGLVSDITERKRAEESLRESEERFRVLADGSPLIIWVTDPGGRIQFVNRTYCEFFGTTLEEVQSGGWQVLVHPDDALTYTELFLECLREHKAYHAQGRVQRYDGQWRWIESYGVPRFAASGEFLGIVGSSPDITERKQAEETLRKWNETLESKVAQRTAELEQRTRQLQRLTLELSQAEERERRRIAVILHEDLQQQIAGARFHLSMVRNRAMEDRQRAEVDRVLDMLTTSIEQSRGLSHDLSPAVLHMNDLAEVLKWLANRVREQRGLMVNVDASGNMALQSEPLTIFLFRAAQEMLLNVVRHAGVRDAAIRVRRRGRYVCLSVFDQGRGFDVKELKETSGIGLFSIRERVESLGGRMRIKSVEGKGSSVRIVVPDGPGRKDETIMPEDVSHLRAASSAVSAPSSDGVLRVLLVDDHEIVRRGLGALLQESADIIVVGEAADGREAVNMANELRPDVVIMDVSMPLMSGDEATRQIKMHLPKTRVIALSMYHEPDTMDTMYNAGADGYVLKTASTEELVAAIRGKKSGS